jgi:hypothetical protein
MKRVPATVQDYCGSTAEQPNTVETTEWSQKLSLLGSESTGDESPVRDTAQGWQYLAQGRAVEITLDTQTLTHINNSCFCDHFDVSADFSDLEQVDLARWRVEMDAIADSFGEAQRRAMLGIINKLTFHIGQCTGALVKDKRRWRVDVAVARRVANAQTLMQCALTDIRDYLEEHWEINVTRQTLTRWVNDCFAGLGIAEWFGVVGQGKKPRTWVVNFPAILLLAEAIERRILADARWLGADSDEAMDALPLHQGYTMVQLFNAIFPGFGWNREGGKEETEPQGYQETDERRGMVSPSLTAEFEESLDALTAIAKEFGTRNLSRHWAEVKRKWPEYRDKVDRRVARLFKRFDRGVT